MARQEVAARTRESFVMAQAASIRVAACWGDAAADFDRVRSSLHQMREPWPLDDILAGLDHAPALRLALAQEQVLGAEVRAAQRSRSLDLDLGLGLRIENETGDRGLVLGFGLPLPVADRGRSEVSAAMADLAAFSHATQSAQRNLRAEVTMRWLHLKALSQEALTLQYRLIPAANAAYGEARRHLESGRLGLTDVLEVRGVLLELQEHQLEILTDYHLAAAALSRLTGRPVLISSTEED